MIIFEIIKILNTRKEINDLIKYRLSTLDTKDALELGIGCSTPVFSNYINKNIKINATCTIVTEEDGSEKVFYGSVKLDDDSIYKYLIKSVKQNDNPYDAVYQAILKYSPRQMTKELTAKRLESREIVYKKYSKKTGKTLSVKLFHFMKNMACLEDSALIHNMFMFLGIESDLVTCGETLSIPHSYNVIYPEGRDKYAVLFDADVSIIDEHPIMFLLDDERRQKLFSHEEISVSEDDVSKAYQKLLGSDYDFTLINNSYYIFKDAYPNTVLDYLDSKKAKKLELKNNEGR